jgi:hypothetical protein
MGVLTKAYTTVRDQSQTVDESLSFEYAGARYVTLSETITGADYIKILYQLSILDIGSGADVALFLTEIDDDGSLVLETVYVTRTPPILLRPLSHVWLYNLYGKRKLCELVESMVIDRSYELSGGWSATVTVPLESSDARHLRLHRMLLITSSTGVSDWVGYIESIDRRLDDKSLTVRCKGPDGILSMRKTGSHIYEGTSGDIVSEILREVNGLQPTCITEGLVERAGGWLSRTFSYTSVTSALSEVASDTGFDYSFRVDSTGSSIVVYLDWFRSERIGVVV